MSPAIVASPCSKHRWPSAWPGVNTQVTSPIVSPSAELARHRDPAREPPRGRRVRRDRCPAARGERRGAADVIAVMMREQHGRRPATPSSAASRIACWSS